MSKSDGGPAFPVHDPFNLEPANVDEMKALASGMSLRDYFAAKAMQALIPGFTDETGQITEGDFDKNIPYLAWAMADAMLAARNT